ncbi:hypothetical protein LTR28_004323 [Elasticomyces elasticus]|nr:hypothetical protein LTR28_004323 [Elasticomyces elasticus]
MVAHQRNGSQEEHPLQQHPTVDVFTFIEQRSVRSNKSTSYSDAGSSSSHVESDTGSSVAPGTPSSRSTFPSPTTTRGTSKADLWSHNGTDEPRYIESPNYDSLESRCDAHHRQASVDDLTEDENDSNLWTSALAVATLQHSRHGQEDTSGDLAGRLHNQEQALRDRVLSDRQAQLVGDHRQQPHRRTSASVSPTLSTAYHPLMTTSQHAVSFHKDPSTRQNEVLIPQAYPSPPYLYPEHTYQPVAPEAPDLTRRTLAGYELLATKLAEQTPDAVDPSLRFKPAYRRFEQLNHRILLHLQDEIAELEEQLRMLDECIAQWAEGDGQHHPSPASRRAEAVSGSELHHRRTMLLGNIFVKTEQYNRALASYASASTRFETATEDDISAYRTWMTKHAPIHEVEARFLDHKHDLVSLPLPKGEVSQQTSITPAMMYFPLIVLIPLVVFSMIPGFLARFFVVFIAAAAGVAVFSGTSVRRLMAPREWMICSAV